MRSEPRMPYAAPVSLRVDADEAAVVGEMHNLSRRGMYVRVVPQPALGTELTCELPGHREVRGRVAWTFNASAPGNAELDGVGIQFVDVSTDRMIDDLIGAHVEEGHPLRVWFAGLSSEARALGRVTEEGIELSTTLDFLRLGTEISIAPSAYADGARLHGKISRVSLRTDGGAPRLAISLSVGAAPVAPAPILDNNDLRWFPEIIVESADLHAAPSVLIEAENTERTPLVIEPPMMEPVLPQRSSWLRATLTVAASVLLVSLIVLRVGFPASDTVPPLPAAPQAVAAAQAPAAVEAPAAAEAPATAEVPAAAEAPAPAPARPAAAPIAAAPIAAAPPVAIPPSATPGEWKPSLTSYQGQPAIIVPVSGSMKGHETFSLDDPPGIFMDLPAGKSAVPMKSYLLHSDDFRSLWVRVRPKGGLQVRLHVAKGVQVAVDVLDGALRFRKKAPN